MSMRLCAVLCLLLWSLACQSSPPREEPLTSEVAQPKPAPKGHARVTADGMTGADLEAFEAGDLYGFRKKGTDQIVLPPIYNFAYDFSPESGLAGVVIDGKWSLIDITGAKIYEPFIYDNGPDYISEGFSRVIDGEGKVGFINTKGELVIAPQFDWASGFEEGVARFCVGCTRIMRGEHEDMEGGRWGTLTPDGQTTYDAP